MEQPLVAKRGPGRPPKSRQEVSPPEPERVKEKRRPPSSAPIRIAPEPFAVDVGPTEYPVPEFLVEAIASNAIVLPDRKLMDMELITRQLLISLFEADSILPATKEYVTDRKWIEECNLGTIFHKTVEYFFKIHVDPEATKDKHAKASLCNIVKWCMQTYERSGNGATVTIEMAYGSLMSLCKRFNCQMADVTSQLKGMFEILNECEPSDDVAHGKAQIFTFWRLLRSVLRGFTKGFWNSYHEAFCMPLLGEDCAEEPCKCLEELKLLAAQCTDDVDKYMLNHCVFVTTMWADIFEIDKKELPDFDSWMDDVGAYHLKVITDIEAKYADSKLGKRVSSKLRYEPYAKTFIERVGPLFSKERGFANFKNPREARVEHEIAHIRATSITLLRAAPEIAGAASD